MRSGSKRPQTMRTHCRTGSTKAATPATWSTASGVLSSLGSTTSVSGVGDKAILGGEQLDVQAGARIIAIEGDAVSTNSSGAEALAKKLISALG